MPFFKVCLLDRKLRVLVKGNTLDEIKASAANKFSIENNQTSLVFETDGTVVDDDEYLQEAGAQAVLYMLLQENEEWTLPGQANGTLCDHS